MKLTRIRIVNFRGLSKIDIELDKPLGVIVGPNAIGKTTFLEAIRFTKALLTPRYQGETDNVLNELGAANNQRIQYDAIVGDARLPLEIALHFTISDDELQTILSNKNNLVTLRVRNSLGIASNEPEFRLAQFFSSPQGQKARQQATTLMETHLNELRTKRTLRIELEMVPNSGTIRGSDLFSHECLMLLEQRLDPTVALISYFPADRAMPPGEKNVQLGAGDATQQMHAHIGQPANKYKRLKNLIISQLLSGKEEAEKLTSDFRLIFDKLIPGKQLVDPRLNRDGSVSVIIEDTDTKKQYDIDRMSSGEKGLILQFLLMWQTVERGGILLLDEPELHLNPAVCKQLLPFIAEEVVKRNDLQALICTHSPEILAEAFEREDCRLFHLRSAQDLSPVHRRDKAEVFEALRRLGASASDVLFSKGTLFVEGIHDVDTPEAGFSERLAGIRLMQLRGRPEVEKEIATLLKADENGDLKQMHYFIFDRDRKLTNYASSRHVRIKQWDRYCLENYLLDADSIFDAISTLRASCPPESRGTLKNNLGDAALAQLPLVVIREVYSECEPDNPGLRPAEIDGTKGYAENANTLFDRLERIRTELAGLDRTKWASDLERKCIERQEALEKKWKEDWSRECDGKSVIKTMQQKFGITASEVDLKKRIIFQMKQSRCDNWKIVDSIVSDLLKE